VRVFALSDIHVGYDVNAEWVANLPIAEYRDDVLILAGDVTDSWRLLEWRLGALTRRFKKVLFTPENHDLWVSRVGASMRAFRERVLSIIPMLPW
jgi:3',5'-cyclic AMP phosphodiesterase CpdA